MDRKDIVILMHLVTNGEVIVNYPSLVLYYLHSLTHLQLYRGALDAPSEIENKK